MEVPEVPAHLLVGGEYSALYSSDNATGRTTHGGWGVRVALFIPFGWGIGPYVQGCYNAFSTNPGAASIYSINAGVSYSY